MVVSIPDWGVTRFAREQDRDPGRIAHELDVFNAVARDETLRAGAHWADVTGISRASRCWSPRMASILLPPNTGCGSTPLHR